ncbi:hypothetical protein [Streptomyces sp. NRRL B-1140]|uniref:hypothetical protein n=1 Tax=Streptomyces sp. NRRL B-1140 TaxID=1415549 RepID=UPI000A878462|nr:hypothetical protein [Streptomyces sp. NRRL B-1140]
MPRGRHRHSPPLHRLLPPSAIAGVSLVCALGPWVFTERMVLRGLAAAAAATAVIGAVVLRRWDTQAGKRVADLTRARASDEWRFEERVAELEADLEESRELRAKLEQRLRAKRTELAGLRNEHAALLRRYATAEAERASVLEDRRVLEIEATAPVRVALPSGASDAVPPSPKPDEAPAAAAAPGVEEQPAVPAVFSPEGSRLFRRAAAALARFDGETVPDPDGGGDGDGDGVPEDEDKDGAPEAAQGPERDQSEQRERAQDGEARERSEAADGHERAAAETTVPVAGTVPAGEDGPTVPVGETESGQLPQPARPEEPTRAEQVTGPGRSERPGRSARPEQPAGRLSGHYTVPTAVAVPPQAPVRRPQAGGGFDFFGTKAGTSSAALEAVQNEDLADVVGQEALALHKAETEARYKPADEESRGIGQVIDLTAHDETEQIDVQGLRSAVS